MIRPAADPGPDRDHDRGIGALGGAVEVLGECREVGVVVDEHRQPCALGDQVTDRHVGDRQVDRGDRDAAVVVDRRRDAEADRELRRGGPRAPRRSRGPASRPARPRSVRWSAPCSPNRRCAPRPGPRPTSSCPRGQPRSSRSLGGPGAFKEWGRWAGIERASALFLAFYAFRRRTAAARQARVQGLPLPQGAPLAVPQPGPLQPAGARQAIAEGRAGPRRAGRQGGGRSGREHPPPDPQVGGDRGGRLDPAQHAGVHGLGPAAGVQALRATPRTRCTAIRSCSPARRRSSSLEPTRGRPTRRSPGPLPRRSASTSSRAATRLTTAARRASSAPTR